MPGTVLNTHFIRIKVLRHITLSPIQRLQKSILHQSPYPHLSFLLTGRNAGRSPGYLTSTCRLLGCAGKTWPLFHHLYSSFLRILSSNPHPYGRLWAVAFYLHYCIMNYSADLEGGINIMFYRTRLRMFKLSELNPKSESWLTSMCDYKWY